LNGTLDEEVYMQQPMGFEVGNPRFQVWMLHKSLYGLKKAGREWYTVLTTFLQQVGFKRNSYEWGIYTTRINRHSVDIAIYVDDILICSSSIDIINFVKNLFRGQYDITDEGELCWHLSIHITRTSNGFFMSQSH
jgi:hypothetical protein